MADKKTNKISNSFAFNPVKLDGDNSTRRKIIKQLPGVHQTETLQKFFGASVDHFFNPGKRTPLNGYVGRKPTWYDPSQDTYIKEINQDRSFYQLEASMISKDTNGVVNNLLFYPDLINQLRFQGANVLNHNRLFNQEYYTWCPPINLDMIINFRQYCWIPQGPDPVKVYGPKITYLGDGKITQFKIPDTATLARNAVNVDNYVRVRVDGRFYTRTTATNASDSTFSYDKLTQLVKIYPVPAIDAEVEIFIYSDFDRFIIGESSIDPDLLGGVVLSTGMRIEILNDVNGDYTSTTIAPKYFIVEQVGTSILLINDTNPVVTSKPDYMVMARGCRDGNPWSTENRWFHRDTIQGLSVDELDALQATRPIIEMERDLELFNYGNFRRISVNLLSNEISDFIATVNNQQKVIIDGYKISAVPEDGWNTVPPEGLRILITGDLNDSVNNRVYRITTAFINNLERLIVSAESDGIDPTGSSTYGEILTVLGGDQHGATEQYWNGVEWVLAQTKMAANQFPLFNLYDSRGVSLGNTQEYTDSTFKGSKIFSFRDDSENSPIDPVLGFGVGHDDQGQIQFENYIASEEFTYVIDEVVTSIMGSFFHKKVDISGDFTLNNDWYKADHMSRQMIVDQFTCDGSSRLFTLSQEPTEDYSDRLDNIEVVRQRPTNQGTVDTTILVDNIDYVRLKNRIMVKSIVKGDSLEVRTFNFKTPSIMVGNYEVPNNLQANPNNEQVDILTKGDFYDHFSQIIRNQTGFKGQEYYSNNWRDTARVKNRGSQILQHSANLLKLMLTCSQDNLSLPVAINYVESEYVRFVSKFEQKITEYLKTNRFDTTNPDTWVEAALEDLAKGKTAEFPFYWDNVGVSSTFQISRFIPPTPSFLGVHSIHMPQIMEDPTIPGAMVIVSHDGSLTPTFGDFRDQVILALEIRIYSSIQSNIKNRSRPLFDYREYYSAKFRTADYSREEYLHILRPSFERWAANNSVAYRNNTTFDANNPMSWNWSTVEDMSGDKLPGHWRGIYHYYYDTDRPHTHPWEMLGLTIKPTWWETRYGTAPYTRNNILLWEDLQNGYIHSGENKGVNDLWARPGLLDIIPVDINGNLLDPYKAGIAKNYPNLKDARQDWAWGDHGPAETTWRRSASFAFGTAMAGYLMKPAAFVDIGWDTNNTTVLFRDQPSEQIINLATLNRPTNRSLKVHGEINADFETTQNYGIQQWISDYLISKNLSITTSLGDPIRGLDVQISYRVGGFLDSSDLFVVSDSFDRVPSEDVAVRLYNSPSIKEAVYSGVIVEWTGADWKVYGYDILNPEFTIIPPDVTSNSIQITLGSSRAGTVHSWRSNTYYQVNNSVRYKDSFFKAIKSHTSSAVFEDQFWQKVTRPVYADVKDVAWYLNAPQAATLATVPYGTHFKTPQEVANFLNGLQRYQKQQGWIFDTLISDSTIVSDWQQSLREFMAWSNDETVTGDFIVLSPCSTSIKFVSPHGTIQPVEQISNGVYSILDKKGEPIFIRNTAVSRSEDELFITPDLTKTTGIFCCRLSVNEVEHVVLLNNKTIFNDVILNPLLNIRQPRLRLQGYKTTDWNGRIDAPGFIITGDTLVPNFETTADDFRKFFNIESSGNDALQSRARANIGFNEKDYLSNLLMTSTNQFELYQGMIQHKGTPTALKRLLRSSFIRHNKGLKFFEEWAFRVGDYGGNANQTGVDLMLLQKEFTSNPQLIEFLNAVPNEVVEENPQIIRVVDRFNTDGSLYSKDSRWAWRQDLENTISWPTKDYTSNEKGFLPTPGYVSVDDVQWYARNQNEFNDLYHEVKDANQSKVLTGSHTLVFDGTKKASDSIDVTLIPSDLKGFYRLNKVEFIVDEVFMLNTMTATIICGNDEFDYNTVDLRAHASSSDLNSLNNKEILPYSIVALNGTDKSIKVRFTYLNTSLSILPNIGKLTVRVEVEHFAGSITPAQRAWVYDTGNGDWSTYKLFDTQMHVNTITAPSFAGQGSVIALDMELADRFNVPFNNVNSRMERELNIVLDGIREATPNLRDIYRPKFSNEVRVMINGSSDGITPLLSGRGSAGMIIDSVSVNVVKPFTGGSRPATIKIGTQTDSEQLLSPFISGSVINPSLSVASMPSFDAKTITVDAYDANAIVAEGTSYVPVEITRSGDIYLLSYRVKILNGGTGYTSLPTISIPGLDGAIATPVITGTSVTKINIVAADKCYFTGSTSTAVTISGGGGTGASAVLEPIYTTATWAWDKVSKSSGAILASGNGGTITFNLANNPGVDGTSHWRQVVNLPVGGQIDRDVVYHLYVTSAQHGGVDCLIGQNSATITVVNSNNHEHGVDIQSPNSNTNPSTITYPDGLDIENDENINAELELNGNTGTAIVTVRYRYSRGFELFSQIGEPVIVDGNGQGGNIFAWMNTRFANPLSFDDALVGRFNDGWMLGDIVELDNSTNGTFESNWVVQKLDTKWTDIRVKSNKVISNLLTNASIYNRKTGAIEQILQVYDPAKGLIPGIAEKEIFYKIEYDPAIYDNENTFGSTWGSEQVHRVWWDLSTLRYLDYENGSILNQDGTIDAQATTNYRWNNWGKLAPRIEIDMYQWTRSTVAPDQWDAYVQSNKSTSAYSVADKPTGVVKDGINARWVETEEWNISLNRNETIYYFWVKDVATVPPLRGRDLSTIQIANVLQNPDASDIPYFAAIESNKIIVGGIKQFLDDTNTVLKLNWQADNNESNHHKQWVIQHEGDDRNEIDPRLWKKLSDSLVGWDSYEDARTITAMTTEITQFGSTQIKVSDTSDFNSQGYVKIDGQWISYSYKNHDTLFDVKGLTSVIQVGTLITQDIVRANPKLVPDRSLTAYEANGTLFRPRQSWFQTEVVNNQTVSSRTARKTFVDKFNEIMATQPMLDTWFDWTSVFEAQDSLPNSDEYQYVVDSIGERNAFFDNDLISEGMKVLVKGTAETVGFWVLYRFVGPTRSDFVIEKAQKWRMQQGELWEAVDWYDSNWGPSDFPAYHFKTLADRDAAGAIDITLFKGTLAKVERQNDNDPRWSLCLYTKDGWKVVGKEKATIKLKDTFYDPRKVVYGLTDTVLSNIANRDGSWELRWIMDKIQTSIFTNLQANEIFFAMVRSALTQSITVDWAVKTSFLYIGGYSETLNQSPVAFKDQIDSVISYIEEVKPYHVVIRDYVRRLSSGPDIANTKVTDFDKPTYVDAASLQNRVLNVNNSLDQNILATSPWNNWYANYQKTNYRSDKWDTQWNPVRRAKTKILFDRVECSFAKYAGWDPIEVPWDTDEVSYTGISGEETSLTILSNKYRTVESQDYDAIVANIEARNQLVRDRKVVPGSICTVVQDGTFWIWSGSEWLAFKSIGWDSNTLAGAASRIKEYYKPSVGMKRVDSLDLISGCGSNALHFDGGPFDQAIFDEFPWDFDGGWANEFAYYAGYADTDSLIQTNARSQPEGLATPVTVDMRGGDVAIKGQPFNDNSLTGMASSMHVNGGTFIQPGFSENRPEESIHVKARGALALTMYRTVDSQTTITRWFKDQIGNWEYINLIDNGIKVVGDITTQSTEIKLFCPGAWSLHDPENPTRDLLDKLFAVKSLNFKYSQSINSTGTVLTFDRPKNMASGDPVPEELYAGNVVDIKNKSGTRRIYGKVKVRADNSQWPVEIEIDGKASTGSTGGMEWFIMPSTARRIPGVIWINNERVEYWVVDRSQADQNIYTIKGLPLRGTGGTSRGANVGYAGMVTNTASYQGNGVTDTFNVPVQASIEDLEKNLIVQTLVYRKEGLKYSAWYWKNMTLGHEYDITAQGKVKFNTKNGVSYVPANPPTALEIFVPADTRPSDSVSLVASERRNIRLVMRTQDSGVVHVSGSKVYDGSLQQKMQSVNSLDKKPKLG